MRRARLILAENHPEIANQFVELLKDEFEVVAVAWSGETLVELVSKREPDAVVSEVNLKGLNGIAATIRIHQQYREIPVVLLSETNDVFLQVEGLAAGASAFLSKTEAIRELVAVLRHLLIKPTHDQST